jgi:hypothetical protein
MSMGPGPTHGRSESVRASLAVWLASLAQAFASFMASLAIILASADGFCLVGGAFSQVLTLRDLLTCILRINRSGTESSRRKDSCKPLRSQGKFWVGLSLCGIGLYGSWLGFSRVETLGRARTLALILISLVMMDGRMILTFVVLGGW